MKLLHILTGTERGGCELNCLVVCREMASARHEVLVLGGPGSLSPEFAASGAKITHLDLPSRAWFRAINPVREYAAQNMPAGVIIWHGLPVLPQLLFALREYEFPIVVHGGNPAHTMSRWVDWKFRLLSWLLPVANLPTYACCSQFVAQSFEHSAYLRRFPRVVISNGVMPVEEARTHRPRSIGPEESFTIGMMARLDPIKDHATLLRAFALVLRECPQARLELAGDGVLRSELEDQAKELGIAQSVNFLGMVKDVTSVVWRWDLFAYATTEQEGMGNAVAEAMMTGLPCVATDVASVREVAGMPPAIRLSPAGHAGALAQNMIELIDDVDERHRLGHEAQARAQTNFSSGVFARRYADLVRPNESTDALAGSARMKIAIAQLGARMHYALPRIFAEAGCLETLYTDLCASKGVAALVAGCPQGWLPSSMRKMASRRADGVPAGRIVNFDSLGLCYWWRLRKARTWREQAEAHIWVGEEFSRLVLKNGLRNADTLYTFNSAGLGLLKYAREHGLRTVHEQAIAPVAVQIRLLLEEQRLWRDWEAVSDVDNFFGPFLHGEQAEWALADRIVCGSKFVLEGLREAGGPVERAAVVPYGVDLPNQKGRVRKEKSARNGRPLRVLTVGTVGLRKGAPYVGEVAAKLRGRAEFRMAGSIDLTDHGRRKLAGAVELLGIIPRDEIAGQYEWADVFLLPSICEGSATATYEALAWGLPVITTPNAGSPVEDGAEGFVVPIRDVPSICAALQQLIDSPDLYDRMNRAALSKRQTLSIAAYGERLLKAIP
jgi:glycosyltransferase involved in cell wall biosynthesis